MILIADSGSTKTDWCVVREGRTVRRFETDGTNPFFQAPEQIERTLASQLLPGWTVGRSEAFFSTARVARSRSRPR